MSKYYTECTLISWSPSYPGKKHRRDHFDLTYETPGGFRFTSKSVDCHKVENKKGKVVMILNSRIADYKKG